MRYAIYVVPGGLLQAVADEWLAAETRTARRYGFHGTLKAPFRLAAGKTVAELTERLTAYGKRQEPIVVPDLTLVCLSGFFALVPGRRDKELHALADEVVREFDDLRAPLTEADLARRRPERLDDRERELLYAYGYPYVFDRFRFHLTLTDPVPLPQRDTMESALRRHFGPFLGRDLVIGSLALFREPESEPDQPFVLVSSHPFTKGAQ